MPTRIRVTLIRALTSLPKPLLKLAGAPKIRDSDILDPDVAMSLKIVGLIQGKEYWEVSIEEARKIIDDKVFLAAGRPAEVGSVTEYDVRGVRVRHYRPSGHTSPNAPLPTVVYFHGGGWTLGFLDSHDATCRWLCESAEVGVFSVDYRLAPEHPFPAGFEDARAVVDAALTAGEIEGVDAQRVAVAGFDPLRDEGEAYARKLAEHGVAVTYRRYAGLVHPFANSTGVWSGARSAMDEIGGSHSFGAADLDSSRAQRVQRSFAARL